VLACLAADLVAREGCESLYQQVKALGIPVDVLINNAGIWLFARMDEVPQREMGTADAGEFNRTDAVKPIIYG
jgi:short-subunit dehydrogenase